jgi:hypothetical protein
MAKKQKNTPSLLEPAARGGDIAEGGLSFQEQVTLAYLPAWLAQNSFTAVIREAMGDTEAKFFVPGHGLCLELLEVKNHTLAPTEFWHEIKRFQVLDNAALGTYRRFTLACTGLSELLHPLYNGLRRLRGPRDFYPNTSAVPRNSWHDYVSVVTGLGYSEDDARFLFEKVDIEPDFNAAQVHGEALFIEALAQYLPDLQDLSGRVLRQVYERLSLLLRNRRNQLIARHEIEMHSNVAIPLEQQLPSQPLCVTTVADSSQALAPTDLVFNWIDFFGGATRIYPEADQWNTRLLRDLHDTRTWIKEQRRPRRIRIRGSRRLSAAIAFGWVFSAVAGFVLEMEYRGELWATDMHATSETPSYVIEPHFLGGQGDKLVVTIGILRHTAQDVSQGLSEIGLDEAPRLELYGSQSIQSPQHANAVVGQIKREISVALAKTQCHRLHLFYAGPSHLALFLGHRMNATVPMQCYEYVAPSIYKPTCYLV